MKIIYARSKDVSGTPCPVCDKPVIIKHGKSKCKNCGAAVMPHDICGACGFYRGTEVVKKSPVTAKSAK